MSVYVLLNLLNELEKEIKCELAQHFISFATSLPYTAVYNPQEYTTRTLTFDPKIREKMYFIYIVSTSNSAF